MAGVTLDQAGKIYASGVDAVKGVSFAVPDGAFCVLVGPPGCGKSTLLRMVAGIETITSGEIRIGDQVVNHIEPADRDIAMVFQNYALYPHMRSTTTWPTACTTAARRSPRSRRGCAISPAASASASPWPRHRAQAQGVPVRRAAVNLDAKLRLSMRVEIKKLQRALATTSIYVTHDQREAMTLADMLVVMNAGRVEQIGAPLAVYEKPTTTFVDSFIGAPPMNLIPMTPMESAQLLDGPPLGLPVEGGIVGVRPEDLSLPHDGARPPDSVALNLTVGAIERVGPATFIYGAMARGGDIIVRVPGQAAPGIGERISAVAARDKLHVFSADGRSRLPS